jgi:hypothetical protein
MPITNVMSIAPRRCSHFLLFVLQSSRHLQIHRNTQFEIMAVSVHRFELWGAPYGRCGKTDHF